MSARNSLVCIFGVFYTHLLFGQFVPCNSSTNKTLYDVWFIDQNIGIDVGDSGTVVRSIDGGLNWDLMLSIDSVSFKKVKFFDSNVGMAIGSHLYRTNDADATWTHVPSNNSSFYDIAILNDTTCVISGTPSSLMRSTDKGLSFFFLIEDQISDVGLLSFVDENIGYACEQWNGGPNPTLKTVDGGATWELLPHLNHNTVMEAMSFVSESVGFKGGWYNPNLQKTSDSAETWDYINYNDPDASGQIFDFHITSEMPNSYYACGWYGQIYKSTDGGDNWDLLESGLGSTISLLGIFFISDAVGWVVGGNGTILRTTNGGTSVGQNEFWTEPNPLFFPNPTNNWCQIQLSEFNRITEVRAFDLLGQEYHIPHNQNRIDLSALSEGVYVVKLYSDSDFYVERIIKQ